MMRRLSYAAVAVLVSGCASLGLGGGGLGRTGEILISASQLAQLLPLPGRFNGMVQDQYQKGGVWHTEGFGIDLVDGPDQTQAIRMGSPDAAPQPCDIEVVGGEHSAGTARMYSPCGVQIGMGPLGTFQAYGQQRVQFGESGSGADSGDADPVRAMVVKQGRRVRFRGSLTLTVADPQTKAPKHHLVYEFGEHAIVAWDPQAQQLVWHDMRVSRREIASSP